MPTTDRDLWTPDLLRNPHAAADKRRRVQAMFAAIAPSYDLNNRLHSLWLDQYWRRRAVELAQLRPDDVVVDVACGTGDLALAFARELDALRYRSRDIRADIAQVIGVDFTYDMLAQAKRKPQIWSARLGPAESQRVGRMSTVTQWVCADAQRLPLPNRCADVVSIAFGIRNVADPAAAIREFVRILRPGGRVVILEFSLPTNPILRALYNGYFRHILPRTATWISGDRTGAYRYLPRSVNTFIGREQMVRMMQSAGLEGVEQFPLTAGVCVCYRGVRRGV